MIRRHFIGHVVALMPVLPGVGLMDKAPRRDGEPWKAYLDDPALGGRADGVTVNDAAFLQALQDMPARGGTIILRPEGEWLFDSVDLSEVRRKGVTLWAVGARVRKSPRTRFHLFHDRLGASDGFRLVGGDFDAGGEHFHPGDVASPFFFSRTDDLTFEGATFHNGIEEGLKLYKPAGVRVHRCRFERFRNNGVQVAASPHDAYEGDKPNRGPRNVHVSECGFFGIDDHLNGMEGQGFSAGSDEPGHPVVDVSVRRCVAEGCVRGLWSENNHSGTPARDVWFDDNVIRRSQFHGLGLVGVKGGGARGNRLLDIGTRWPGPGTSSETAGIILSGSEALSGEDLVIEDNEVVDGRGADARMQWGIVLRRQRRIRVCRNQVVGATIAPMSQAMVSDSDVETPSRFPL